MTARLAQKGDKFARRGQIRPELAASFNIRKELHFGSLTTSVERSGVATARPTIILLAGLGAFPGMSTVSMMRITPFGALMPTVVTLALLMNLKMVQPEVLHGRPAARSCPPRSRVFAYP